MEKRIVTPQVETKGIEPLTGETEGERGKTWNRRRMRNKDRGKPGCGMNHDSPSEIHRHDRLVTHHFIFLYCHIHFCL